jgi:hypothetical protein
MATAHDILGPEECPREPGQVPVKARGAPQFQQRRIRLADEPEALEDQGEPVEMWSDCDLLGQACFGNAL